MDGQGRERARAPGAPSLRSAFEEDGFVGPIRLLDGDACRGLLAELEAAPEPPWAKGHAVSSTAFYEIASRPELVDLVTALIGEDVLLWGAILVRRTAGEVHPWHTDIETSGVAGSAGRTLSAWIGLENTNRGSALQVIPGSHRIGATVQQCARAAGRRRSEISPDDVLGWAGRTVPGSRIDTFDMTDGEAILFDGALWHGTNNANEEGTRTALLLQYATPDRPIRIPDYGRLEWPFRILESPLPPCILLRGDDAHGVNRVVAPPTPRTVIGRLPLPLGDDPAAGWLPHRLFRGVECAGGLLSSHASVLSPGCQPHDPHVHAEEELLLVLDGEPELVIVDDGRERIEPAGPGTLAYYPRTQRHTIRNPGPGNASYMMLKWAGAALAGGRPTLDSELHHIAGRFPDPAGRGLVASRLFEGPTAYLAKLHSHLTALEPGGGYEPHRDLHDVAIVLLEGVVETRGERVEPVGVIFHPAGEPHGIRNVGDGPARYVVFELHGVAGEPMASASPEGSRTRRPSLRADLRRVLRR